MTKPHAWIRRTDVGDVELFFPFDAQLVTQFKALIPWERRTWNPAVPSWIVSGEPHTTRAEEWFSLNCGRGKEVAKGQMELAL